MLEVLAYAGLYLIVILLIISVCALLVLGSDMVEKDRAAQAKEQKREKELSFNNGPSRWEMQRTVNRLLKADKKRPRRVW